VASTSASRRDVNREGTATRLAAIAALFCGMSAAITSGHSLFHTLLLSAFLNRKEVSLLIDGCVFSKPRIIAAKIR
jgi:hypothetical protein